MDTPPGVTAEAWQAAHQALLIEEKAVPCSPTTRLRPSAGACLVSRRYRLKVRRARRHDKPARMFAGQRQLVIYRAFFEPGVHGWPDHTCIGCSLGADQVGHLAHLNARHGARLCLARTAGRHSG